MKPVSSSVAQATFSKPVPPGIAKKEEQLPPGQLKRLDNLPKGIEARFPRPEPVTEPPPAETTQSTAGTLGSTLDVTV
jgi:hypothetical protein